MNYFARLVLQSGLLERPARTPALPETLEIVETVELPSPEASGAEAAFPRSVPTQPPMPFQPLFEEREGPPSSIDKHVDVAPALPTQDPATVKRPNEASRPSPAPTARRMKPPEKPDTFPPEAPPSPDSVREMRIRQVLEWVATNERLPAQEGVSEPPITRRSDTHSTTETPRPAHSSRLDASDLPFLEISQPAPAQTVSAHPVPPRERPAPARERQSPTPPENGIVEEHIDISIGAIRLEVTPPPTSADAKRSPPAAPAPPAPRGLAPATTSRLRRRFIRV
ncbi:hypothetical protein [Pararhodobacter sp. SW119]|uniref:hypothetical protein n=1 Tax=Pararhodobacter sp. SW119 TaxID=2780075 RepID=UPI001ADFB93E|nr:hypothetical protein [Pararhodobacter sp. SW119]